MHLAREFMLLLGLGFFVAGLTTYIMTWILVAVHLRDHHPAERARLGGFMFSPRAFGWYLARRYRALRDKSLTGLARLGAIGAWAIVLGALSAFAAKATGGFGP
ncbi:hypothetical protein [Dokdonella sp.]|jgi:hypothetical protein|uniref:hypothetical protein n=1 Tax=Dokdonella sp. TaxID=2291710 RepID=UPI003528B0D7